MRQYIVTWKREGRTHDGTLERFTTLEAAQDFKRELIEHREGVWYVGVFFQETASHCAIKLEGWCR